MSVADSIRGYSGESFEQVASVALGFSQYFQNVGVAVNRNTNRVYVAWSGNNSLFMIDGNTHLITKNVVPSYFNETVMVNPNTDKVYVGTTILDGETLEQVSTSLDESIEAIDPINNLLYTVGTLNYLFRLNGSSHVLIDSVQLPWTYFSYYDRVPVNPASSKIYITNYYDNKTCVVSAGSPPEPTPSPTPSPTPTATPSPTPTATPTPTPTPTAPPTPKPTQSPSPSPPPTPSPSPTATPTPTPSPSPEPKGFSLPMEGIYVGIGVIAIAAIAGTAILVKKPQKRTNKGYPPPLPPPPIFQT